MHFWRIFRPIVLGYGGEKVGKGGDCTIEIRRMTILYCTWPIDEILEKTSSVCSGDFLIEKTACSGPDGTRNVLQSRKTNVRANGQTVETE